MMNKRYETISTVEMQNNLTDILGEELSQQLQSTMRQASERQLIELRDSLKVMSQWLQEQASEQQPAAV
ncbi:hypothetical protein ACFQI7_03460 [Paenibacillus allorhizosphaerae]|uniref:Uncharacterized protein n=1 Tax=Paenibacillus allorhizosphaerae TaxID=2849866 RepID=A0ABM8VCU4_9BACL|nr:hypothetical protein [Paenibacillus allorhizosphaerae]CAG7625132.1 hypothetical protein PAECIP111802_01136 [Paenibacillus allorhizosphaerae]